MAHTVTFVADHLGQTDTYEVMGHEYVVDATVLRYLQIIPQKHIRSTVKLLKPHHG